MSQLGKHFIATNTLTQKTKIMSKLFEIFFYLTTKDNIANCKNFSLNRVTVRTGATGASAPAEIRQHERRTRSQDLMMPF